MINRDFFILSTNFWPAAVCACGETHNLQIMCEVCIFL